jgi:N-methylhydantoinase A
LKTKRRAWFAEVAGWVETPVYDRYALGPEATFEGPAIVEERESTAVIGPGARCRVDEGLTIVVTMP